MAQLASSSSDYDIVAMEAIGSSKKTKQQIPPSIISLGNFNNRHLTDRNLLPVHPFSFPLNTFSSSPITARNTFTTIYPITLNNSTCMKQQSRMEWNNFLNEKVECIIVFIQEIQFRNEKLFRLVALSGKSRLNNPSAFRKTYSFNLCKVPSKI